MVHTQVVTISVEDLNRINRLLEIPSLSEMSDEELEEAGASTDYSEFVFAVEFDDGTHLEYYLRSGQENYYDDVIWTDAGEYCGDLLDCGFELGDIEFTASNGEDYLVRLNLV